MTIRGALYDAISYMQQVDEARSKHRQKKDYRNKDEFLSGFHKEDVLTPVITIVVYYGRKKWDAHTSLQEMMDLSKVNSSILEYIMKYEIAVICPREMDEDELNRFHTDLKQIFGFLRYDHDEKELIGFINKNKEAYSNMDRDACVFIEQFSRIRLPIKKWKKEGNDMCKAIDDIRRHGIEMGEALAIKKYKTEWEKIGEKEAKKEAKKEGRQLEKKSEKRLGRK